MTKSSKPNLRHLKRSLTIRHFLTPPMACSIRIRKPDIFLFSSFCASDNCLPLGFFAGIFTVTFSGLCPRNPVSCRRIIPEGKLKGCLSAVFYHEHFRHRSWKAAGRVFEAYKAGCFSRHEFFLPLQHDFCLSSSFGRSAGLSVPSGRISLHCSARHFTLK
ncbi:hypothetical protein Barb6_01527 [Bacteroidales bacterium Barb6]|nr:hypothetical protein Barb6_01527 [Bacteroidales bacterium Barb6]